MQGVESEAPTLRGKVGILSDSPSILGIVEFIVPTGSFFHAQTHGSFHIMEELSPNVRMIQDSLSAAFGQW
jgi:hypothetical protein